MVRAHASEATGEPDPTLFPRGVARLVRGDCLSLARGLPPASIDLIYADPPFFTGRTQGLGRATFADDWEGLRDYLDWLTLRLEAMRSLLKPTGSLYVHLDWHAVHYVKVELDRIFGYDHFLNEIVWLYGLGGSSARYWPRKHDTLLWYARERGRHHFEAARVPARSRRMRGLTKKAPDWWDIPALNNMAAERLGYPTQKPEALLERIVRAASLPGSRVLDPMCGSGTTLAVAARLGRRYAGIDASPVAFGIAARRLGLGA
jgi:adenine-specific DNA-methyltransferase